MDKNFFFMKQRVTNTEYYLVFRNHQISNTIRYCENPITEYQILFGIEKIQIPNMNSTIGSNYSNTKYLIPNSIQNIVVKATKMNIFVSYKTFCLNFF